LELQWHFEDNLEPLKLQITTSKMLGGIKKDLSQVKTDIKDRVNSHGSHWARIRKHSKELLRKKLELKKPKTTAPKRRVSVLKRF